MTKQEAIDFVTKNCYNSVTREQVRDIIDLLEKIGMKPPLKTMTGVIEQGVSFKIPVYEWEE